MGGACCKPDLEYNPDGTQKPVQTSDQKKQDPVDLRKAAQDGALDVLQTLVSRMPRHQINGAAGPKEVPPEQAGYTPLHFCASINHLRGVKKLVLHGAALNPRDASGATPLHVQMEAGKRKVAHFLLCRGADRNKKNRRGQTPVMVAFATADKGLAKWILEWTTPSTIEVEPEPDPKVRPPKPTLPKGVDPKVYRNMTKGAAPKPRGAPPVDLMATDLSGNTYITLAARYGWFDLVCSLVEKLPENPKTPKAIPALLNLRNSDGEHALGWVLKYAATGAVGEDEAAQVVQVLLSKGASPLLPAFKEGVPPLALAVLSGSQKLYDMLVQAAPQEKHATLPQVKDGLGRTLLHYAAAKNRKAFVDSLLGAGVAATQADSNGDTPLHIAALRGHRDVLSSLLGACNDTESKAALTSTNRDGLAVLHMALKAGPGSDAQRGALEVMEVLAALPVPEGMPSPLAQQTKSQSKDTPLLVACGAHAHVAAQTLITKYNQSATEANACGELPLARCLASATPETAPYDASVFQVLLDADGVKLDVADPSQSPLLGLCKNEVSDFAQLVIEKIGPGNEKQWEDLKDEAGRGPLHLAAWHNNAYMVRYLLDTVKLEVGAQDPEGLTPLHYAAWGCAPAAATLLLNRGADASVEDKEGKPPMAHCLHLDRSGSLVVAALLLKGGAKPIDAVDIAGEGLLHRAVRYGTPDFIRLWAACGGKMELTCTSPLTADILPDSLAQHRAMVEASGKKRKAAKDADIEVPKCDLLDEEERVIMEMDPEAESEEADDGEEEAARKGHQEKLHALLNPEEKKEEGAGGAVAEGVDESEENEEEALWEEELELESYYDWEGQGLVPPFYTTTILATAAYYDMHNSLAPRPSSTSGDGDCRRSTSSGSVGQGKMVGTMGQAVAVAEATDEEVLPQGGLVAVDASGYFTGPDKRTLRQWRVQGSGWWQEACEECDEEDKVDPDQDLVLSQPSETEIIKEDWFVDQQGASSLLDLDDMWWEMIERKERGLPYGPQAVAESLLPRGLNRVAPEILREKGEMPDPELSTKEYALKQAKEHYKELYARKRFDPTDPYFRVETLYSGVPMYCQGDTAPTSESIIEDMINSMEARLEGYKSQDAKEKLLAGGELRERTLTWWLKSLSPEEFPLKVGMWQKELLERKIAIRAARKAVPNPARKPRKRTAFIGLPQLPSFPELEDTTALIYAVRLGRVSCLRALLDCLPYCKVVINDKQGDKLTCGIDHRDRYGHTALEYAYWLLARDPKKPQELQAMVDMLLFMRPAFPCTDFFAPGKPGFGSTPFPYAPCNAMDPLCLATVSYDLERIVWMVRMCGAPLDHVFMFAPDIPAYIQGKWEVSCGSWEARMAPIHIAIMHRRTDIVRLLLDLGADPNIHAWGFKGPIPYKLREEFLEVLQKARTKGQNVKDSDIQERFMAKREWEIEQGRAHVESSKTSFLGFVGMLPVGKAISGIMNTLIKIKNIIAEFLFDPDTWVSALHLAGRFGSADCAQLLLKRGAAPNGGTACTMARRSPLEEALNYARANFTYDNKSAKRHNWEVVKARAWEFPTYSPAALAKKANAAAMAFMSAAMGDPTTITMKMVIMAAKVAIDMLIDSMRRPIAHFDPAMAAAHVMIRECAPLKADDTQTASLVRDLTDNGTWVFMGDVELQDDAVWIQATLTRVEEMRADKKYSFNKIGKTGDFKEHDKLVKKFEHATESMFVINGAKSFYAEYNKIVKEKAPKITEVSGQATINSMKAAEANLKTMMAGRAVVEMLAAERRAAAEKAFKEHVEACKAAKGSALFEESHLQGGGDMKMAPFDLSVDPQTWQSKSGRLSVINAASGSYGAVGPTGMRVSRLSVLSAVQAARTNTPDNVATAMMIMDVAAGGPTRKEFEVPVTLQEKEKNLDPLGVASEAACDKERQELVSMLKEKAEGMKAMAQRLAGKGPLEAVAKSLVQAVDKVKLPVPKIKTGKRPDKSLMPSKPTLSKSGKAKEDQEKALLEKVEKKLMSLVGETDEEEDGDWFSDECGEEGGLMLEQAEMDVEAMMELLEAFQNAVDTVIDFVESMA